MAYINGKEVLFSSHVSYGYDEGKQAEYDGFWDSYQRNGERTNYMYAFSGAGWTPKTLKPKYKIAPTDATSMFYICGYTSYQDVIDYATIADKFDFSKATKADNLFYSARIDNIYVDLSSATSANNAFNGGWTSSLKSLTLKVTDKLTKASNMFDYLHTLEHLIFTEGSSIVFNGLNLQWSTKLDRESIESIINVVDALYVEAITLSLAAVNKAFETYEGANDGTESEDWMFLENQNYTIALV